MGIVIIRTGGISLQEGAHTSYEKDNIKHDFYGFAEQNKDGNFIGFKYSQLNEQGNSVDFDFKIKPGNDLLKEREPVTENDQNALKLFDSFKDKALIKDEDVEGIKTYMISQISSQIESNSTAKEYFVNNASALNDLYETVDNFTKTLSGEYLEAEIASDMPTTDEFVNILNEIMIDNAPANLNR